MYNQKLRRFFSLPVPYVKSNGIWFEIVIYVERTYINQVQV